MLSCSPGRGGERKWRSRCERTAASTSSLGSRAEAPASLSGTNRRRAYACRGLGGSLVLRCPRLPRLGRTSCSTWLSAAPRPGSGAAIRTARRLGAAPCAGCLCSLACRPPAALEEAMAKGRQHACTPRAVEPLDCSPRSSWLPASLP